MTNMVNSLNASLALCEEENNSTMASDLSTALTEKKVREPMIFFIVHYDNSFFRRTSRTCTRSACPTTRA